MEQSPLEASSHSASQEIPPTLYGSPMFITMFTRACHSSLSWARWIQSTPSQPIYVRCILILSSQLCLGLPSNLFPSAFPTKILYTFQDIPTWDRCDKREVYNLLVYAHSIMNTLEKLL